VSWAATYPRKRRPPFLWSPMTIISNSYRRV
jgi:hypothetical protein